MPQRTNAFQMIVNFVRKQLAQPGVTVTESKLLHDTHLDIDREVDIVIEGNFDGEAVVTSIEVIDRGRPADVMWVQQQIEKHRYLPTNRLVLLSRQGFSKNALAAIAAQGGWVDAVVPTVLMVNGQPAVTSLFVDQIRMKLDKCRMYVLLPNGQVHAVQALPDNTIYDGDGTELGAALHLATEALNLDWVRTKFAEEAHRHPERDSLEAFFCNIRIDRLGYNLRKEPSGELHLICILELEGKFDFAQEELRFTIADMKGRRYGFGEATILDRPTVWVATTDEETQKTEISWRTKDDKPLFQPQDVPVFASYFPGLRDLVAPDWSPVPPEDDSDVPAEPPSLAEPV